MLAPALPLRGLASDAAYLATVDGPVALAARRDGMVSRTVMSRVDHELTPLGPSRWDPAGALGQWAHARQGAIGAARRRFDAARAAAECGGVE